MSSAVQHFAQQCAADYNSGLVPPQTSQKQSPNISEKKSYKDDDGESCLQMGKPVLVPPEIQFIV